MSMGVCEWIKNERGFYARGHSKILQIELLFLVIPAGFGRKNITYYYDIY